MPEKAKRGAEAFRGLVYYVAEKMNIKFGKVAMKTAKHYNEKAKQKYPGNDAVENAKNAKKIFDETSSEERKRVLEVAKQ